MKPGETMSNGPDPSPPPLGESTPQIPKVDAPQSSLGKLSVDDLITLNEEIAGMARAGLPLDEGLRALAREMGRGRLQKTTRQLADDLKAGLTLPQALERQGGRVPPYYAALLAAGIRSGRINEVLATLTLYARAVADFRANVVSALVYPGVVLAVGLGLVVFVGATTLPAFVDIFDQFKLRLPLLTQVLVFIGEHPLQTVVLPAAVLILAPVAVRGLLLRGPRGRIAWAMLVNSLPVVGTMIRSTRLAAFADLLGILVDQAVPLPEAWGLAAEASSDPLVSHGAKQVEHDLRQGVPLGDALKDKRLVPELVVWMTRFGQQQGTLGPTLHHLSQMYRRQAEIRAGLLRTLLPPLLIIGLAGIMVALFVFGLMAPMFALLEGLSGGGRR
jgi:general secretion pathway protein F